ncbi:hypothetical protein JS533_009025 [Bifidobacterium amazonense]|uniref:Serine/threonine protein kinase n=1 Tax=Bifidobacterium amazonense TaxID=2809027 RepID=A0ABS9VWB9_9BIFI|nr:hypothetical protein [Bifidobacterium amazonense]MCH9276406.1 hypothetical protein [Bifidobacterium amazonense]
MAKITPAPGALFDGGNFRLYDNRIEINKYGLLGGLKGFGVVYYSDVAGVTVKGKYMTVKKAAMKNAILLQFKKKEQAQEALNIINANKA